MNTSKDKIKLVIFEGADKVGKGTLYLEYRKATKFQPLALDRFTGSNWVYDQVYGRTSDLDAYLESEKQMQEIYDCYLIYLTAPEHVIRARVEQQETGIYLDRALANFQKANELFLKYFLTETKFKQAKMINTGIMSEKECLEEILYFTHERGLQNEKFDINI